MSMPLTFSLLTCWLLLLLLLLLLLPSSAASGAVSAVSCAAGALPGSRPPLSARVLPAAAAAEGGANAELG
jgi:hypothetical protein